MNSYLARNKAQMTSQVNPQANQFVPLGNYQNNRQDEIHPEAQAVKAEGNLTDHQV